MKPPRMIKVGVSAIAFDAVLPKKLLLIQRGQAAATLQKSLWSFPGGHLEFEEKIDDGILRELREETGFRANIMEKSIMNITEFLENHQHYIIFSKCCIFTEKCKDTVPENLVQRQYYLNRYDLPYESEDDEQHKIYDDYYQDLNSLRPEECIEHFFPILDGIMLRQFNISVKKSRYL